MKISYIKYIPYIVIFILMILLGAKSCENNKLSKENEEKQTLLATLNDSLHIVKNKNGELEYSKKSLQNDISFLKENINLLSNNQKKLIKEISNDKNIIAAMRADMNVLITHIKNTSSYTQPNDTTLIFTDDSTFLKYQITVSGIKVTENNKPQLTIDTIKLPNTTTVKFEWEDGKEHPVKGTIVNSNPYMIVDTLDSFIIPEIKQEEIKPNTWQKIKKLTNKTGSKLILIGTGIVIGLAVSVFVL